MLPRTTRRPTVTAGGAFGDTAGFTDNVYSASCRPFKPFKLCYMFGDEPWKLFNVYVVSSQVNSRDYCSVDGQASLGENKIFA